MSIVTTQGTVQAREVSAAGFAPCCGLAPQVLRWPRKPWVSVSCRNPRCELHEQNGPPDSDGGVLAHEADIVAKWERVERERRRAADSPATYRTTAGAERQTMEQLPSNEKPALQPASTLILPAGVVLPDLPPLSDADKADRSVGIGAA